MKRAIFLDRDGVINKAILKEGKPSSPKRFERFEFLEGVREVLEKFRREGFLNIIITNQPDIKRGLMKWETLEKMHRLIKEDLPIDDIFVCPHDDIDSCQCRKPRSGMLLEAAKRWDIDLKGSFLVGDQSKDMEAGKNAGCITIIIDYLYNREAEPDFRVNDLQSAMKIVLNDKKKE